MKNKKFFSENLIKWDGSENNRKMPWKGEKDPYRIWISEIVLQQTRVSQGLEYYERFIRAFPDIGALATAPEKEVFKLWEGLGYYSRCRNLIATAVYLHEEMHGKFPEKFEDILKLKGIGNYTASAIASFAFNQPYAVLDGNVFRVLSRFFGIDTPVDSTEGKKQFAVLAQELIDPKAPALYNQAIMDFGALICKPAQPLCSQCPLQTRCQGLSAGMVEDLPVKSRRVKQTRRYFNYLLLQKGPTLYVHQRTGRDIWEHLHEPLLIETDHPLSAEELMQSSAFKSLWTNRRYHLREISGLYTQKLTHQLISARFFHIELDRVPPFLEGYEPLAPRDLAGLAFPKIIASYLKEKKYL